MKIRIVCDNIMRVDQTFIGDIEHIVKDEMDRNSKFKDTSEARVTVKHSVKRTDDDDKHIPIFMYDSNKELIDTIGVYGYSDEK